jgi:ABC-type glycerol-3-phosphate transport system substrate-binding protein
VRWLAPAWQARQQARIEVVPQAKTGADVRVIRPAELARLAKAGGLRVLPSGRQAPEGYEWPRLLSFYREPLLKWDTRVYALPLAGEALVCVWRSDLFADPARRDAYRAFVQASKAPAGVSRELKAPATWEEYALIAEFFARRGPDGKPGPSLPALPAGEEDLDRLFWTVAASCARRAVPADEATGEDPPDEVFSFHCDQRTGKPRIAGPGFVLALEHLQRLQAFRPEGTTAQPEEAFRDGRAVLCLCAASWLVPFQKAPGVRDRFGICQVPGAARYYTAGGEEKTLKAGTNRVPYLGAGGWLAVVPHDAPSPEAAVDFLQAITGPAASAQAAMEPRFGGGPTRNDSQQLQRERWDSFDLDAARMQELSEAVKKTLALHGLKNPALVLRVPDQAQRRKALVVQLRRALLEKGQAQECLEQAAQAWRALDQKKGPAAAKADYRISLGLLGQ